MQTIAPEIVALADASLGGLHGRSALLVGPKERRQPYIQLLQQAGIQTIYQEDTALHLSARLAQVQLLMSMPDPTPAPHAISAALIAQSCIGRHVPLIIFDLAEAPSVEDLAGLLPSVCLYTPDDLQRILSKSCARVG